MIFRAVSKASFKAQFNLTVLLITLSSVVAVFALSWIAGRAAKIGRKNLGTYIQSSIHGNLGYIALAVAYYYMGQEGFVKAGIIGGFVMISPEYSCGGCSRSVRQGSSFKGERTFFRTKDIWKSRNTVGNGRDILLCYGDAGS